MHPKLDVSKQHQNNDILSSEPSSATLTDRSIETFVNSANNNNNNNNNDINDNNDIDGISPKSESNNPLEINSKDSISISNPNDSYDYSDSDTINGIPTNNDIKDISESIVVYTDSVKTKFPITDSLESIDTILTNPTPEITYPEGGLQAWLVVFGGMMLFFCSFGWCNTFGIFQTYYVTSGFLTESRSAVSWIGSLQMWGAFFGAGIAGSLFDKFGARPIVLPGSLVLVFGIMMQSLCTQYYQLILAQGLLQGLAIGSLFTPSAAACNHWFLKKRGMATGIVVGGSSLGGVFWPILLNHLLNQTNIGFAWSLRICAFISLVIMVPSSLLVKGRLPKKVNFQPWALKAFTNRISLVYLISCFFIFWGCFIPYTYLGLRSKEHGMTTQLAFYITAVLNAGSFVGRIIPGILGDIYGRYNTYIICATFMGILALLWLTSQKVWQDMLFAAAFGAASGSCVSLSGPCIAHLAPHPSEIGTYMGTMFLIISIASLTGSPIAGQIVSAEDGLYTGAIIFAGISILLGCGFLVVSRLWQEPRIFKRF